MLRYLLPWFGVLRSSFSLTHMCALRSPARPSPHGPGPPQRRRRQGVCACVGTRVGASAEGEQDHLLQAPAPSPPPTAAQPPATTSAKRPACCVVETSE